MIEKPGKPNLSTPPPTEEVFRAMADSGRQKTLQLLVMEELSVSELVDVVQLPQSTVSRHLKVLREAGLIRDRRLGKTTLYRAMEVGGEADGVDRLLVDWLRRQPVSATLRKRLERRLRSRDRGGVGFFERLGKRWDELRVSAFGDAFAFEAVLALLPSDWTVADIGTGTGFLLPALADHFHHVIAVEPAHAMLQCARQRVAEHGAGNVTYHHGELGEVPIKDATCDLAIACLVLHHVPKPAAALAEMHRIIRPGGRVLIVEQDTHENQAFYETMQDTWWGFEANELTAQMQAAGFERVRHYDLQSAEGRSHSMEAPDLYVLAGERSGGSR